MTEQSTQRPGITASKVKRIVYYLGDRVIGYTNLHNTYSQSLGSLVKKIEALAVENGVKTYQIRAGVELLYRWELPSNDPDFFEPEQKLS